MRSVPLKREHEERLVAPVVELGQNHRPAQDKSGLVHLVVGARFARGISIVVVGVYCLVA